MVNNNPIRKVREDIRNCLDRNQSSLNDNVRETLENILDYTQVIECGHCHKELKKNEIKFVRTGCLNVPSPYCQNCVVSKGYQLNNR